MITYADYSSGLDTLFRGRDVTTIEGIGTPTTQQPEFYNHSKCTIEEGQENMQKPARYGFKTGVFLTVLIGATHSFCFFSGWILAPLGDILQRGLEQRFQSVMFIEEKQKPVDNEIIRAVEAYVEGSPIPGGNY